MDNHYTMNKKSEAELLREQNIKERDAFLASFMSDPEFAEAMTAINSYNVKPAVKKQRRSRKENDTNFKFTGYIPLERRKSARIKKLPPEYTKDDLIDDTEYSKYRKNNDGEEDFDNLEEVVYHIPKKRKITSRNSSRTPIIAVEDVTDEMLNNISRKVSTKVYHESGTSCHQCRQKTKDTKTCCRNENCIGVRGQFCGVCMINRYGEDAADALKDPNWNCFVCRGICNCSFCRAKAGKRPTGILTPVAHQQGHKSVKDFLESLRGEGDFSDQDKLWQQVKNPANLLGFSNLHTARMGGNVEEDLHCNNVDNFLKYLKQKFNI